MSDDLRDAFEATHYRVFLDDTSHVLHIGSPCPAAVAAWISRHVGTRCGWLISACNPGAQRIDDARNRVRDQLLREWAFAHGSTWLEAVNEDPAHRWPVEASVLVAGIEEGQVRSMARRLGQLAIVTVSANRPPTLVWVK